MEVEGHSDDDHKEGVRESSPSLPPHKRPRIHDPPSAPPFALPLATQSSDSPGFTDTLPRPLQSDLFVGPTTSPLASASSAWSTSSSATAPSPHVARPLSPPRTATHASVSSTTASEGCRYDAMTELQHVVTAARVKARNKEPAEQQRIVQAFAFLNKREMQNDINNFAHRTITNAYAPLDTRREGDRALLLQLFIETFLES